jgi:tripartite motif-containing protein 9/67
VASFSLDPSTAHPDVQIGPDLMSANCSSFDHRVVLGSLGFSRGVHFWEFTVDKYDGNADVAFGIAKPGVAKDNMLGTWNLEIRISANSTVEWNYVENERNSKEKSQLSLYVFFTPISTGKDNYAWSMYVDSKRSWFVHGDKHSQRVEGGIDEGCTVGVLLDLVQGSLSFFINEEPQVSFFNN